MKYDPLYFDLPHAVDVGYFGEYLGHLTNFTTSQTGFFIFTFRSWVLPHEHGFGFLRHGFGSFLRHRHRFGFFRSLVRQCHGFRFCMAFFLNAFIFALGEMTIPSPSHGPWRGRRVARGSALYDHETFNLRRQFIHNQLARFASSTQR